jgi:hypothetical protein
MPDGHETAPQEDDDGAETAVAAGAADGLFHAARDSLNAAVS